MIVEESNFARSILHKNTVLAAVDEKTEDGHSHGGKTERTARKVSNDFETTPRRHQSPIVNTEKKSSGKKDP